MTKHRVTPRQKRETYSISEASLEIKYYIMTMSTQEFATFIAGEAKKWPPIIKAIGFKAQ